LPANSHAGSINNRANPDKAATEISMRILEINREPVELCKLLKFEGIIGTGGEAKLLIGDGQVSVNGAIETRKRKKIVDGDLIEFAGEKMLVKRVP
jgi:ribosome-associated protein